MATKPEDSNDLGFFCQKMVPIVVGIVGEGKEEKRKKVRRFTRVLRGAILCCTHYSQSEFLQAP